MPNTALTADIVYRGSIYLKDSTNYPLAALKGLLGGITLLGVSGTVNVKGFFRDSRGRRTGVSYAPVTPVPGADSTANSGLGVDPVSLLSYLGLSVTPAGAVDFLICSSDGDLYYDTGDNGDSDMALKYVNYPIITAVTGRGDITPLVGLQ